MMTREQMIDEVIRTNGFENKWTIWFCELAEDTSISDSALLNAMVCATTMPTVEMEEEEDEQSSFSFFIRHCGAHGPCAPNFIIPRTHTICQEKSAGKVAQIFLLKFVQFVYCIFMQMCYTIITERE